MSDHLNLMSIAARRREMLRLVVRAWSRAILLLAVMLAPLGYWKWRAEQRASGRRAAAELRYEPVRDMRAENGRLKKELEAVLTKQRVPLALARQESVLSLVAAVSRAVDKQGQAVYLEQLELQVDPRVLVESGTTEASVVLTGTGRDGAAVAQLVESLRAHGPFRTVQVDSRASDKSSAPELQSFTIECTL